MWGDGNTFVCLFPEEGGNCPLYRVSLVAQMVKKLSAMQETQVLPRVGKIPWRRKGQPTPGFLPGESHGQRSLVGYIQFVGLQGVGHDWAAKHFHCHRFSWLEAAEILELEELRVGAENRALGSGREMTLTGKKQTGLNKQAQSGSSDLIVSPSRIKRKLVIGEGNGNPLQ